MLILVGKRLDAALLKNEGCLSPCQLYDLTRLLQYHNGFSHLFHSLSLLSDYKPSLKRFNSTVRHS